MTKRKAKKPPDHDEVFETRANREEFMQKLQMLKVAVIRIEYSGSGDSGQVDSVDFYDVDDKPIEIPNGTKVPLLKRFSRWVSGGWEENAEVMLVPLEEAAEAIFYCVDAMAGFDWHNNEGGSGSCRFLVEGGQLKIKNNISINITTTDDHSFEY